MTVISNQCHKGQLGAQLEVYNLMSEMPVNVVPQPTVQLNALHGGLHNVD